MAAERQGFTMYHEKWDGIRALGAEAFGKMAIAALNYSETGELPDFSNEHLLFSAMWDQIRGSIDRSIEAWEKSVEAGRRGGLKSAEMRKQGASTLNSTQAPLSTVNQPNTNPIPNPIPNRTEHEPDPNRTRSVPDVCAGDGGPGGGGVSQSEDRRGKYEEYCRRNDLPIREPL